MNVIGKENCDAPSSHCRGFHQKKAVTQFFPFVLITSVSAVVDPGLPIGIQIFDMSNIPISPKDIWEREIPSLYRGGQGGVISKHLRSKELPLGL